MTNVVVAVVVYVSSSCCCCCCCCGSYCCCILFGAATNYRQSCRCWLFDSEPTQRVHYSTISAAMYSCLWVVALLPYLAPLGHASSLPHPRGNLFKATSCSSSVTYLHKALHKQPYPRDSSCWCSTMCNNSHQPDPPPPLLCTPLPVIPKLVWVQSLASHTASTPYALRSYASTSLSFCILILLHMFKLKCSCFRLLQVLKISLVNKKIHFCSEASAYFIFCFLYSLSKLATNLKFLARF